MPILDNERYERFSQEIAKGVGPSRAYEIAGFEAQTAASKAVGAHKLSKKPAIVKRVAEIQTLGALRAEREVGVTKGRVLQMLLDSYENATERKQFGPAVRAVELMGKTQGLFVDRHDVRGGPLDDLSFDLDGLIDTLNAEIARRENAGESADTGSSEPGVTTAILR